MAGITGICSTSLHEVRHSIDEAADLTIYSRITEKKHLIDDGRLCMTRSFVTFLQVERDHAHHDETDAWLDGEIFNLHEFSSDNTFCELLLKHYSEGKLYDFLRKVDGIFVAVIYDRKKQNLLLITDRNGLRPLYITHQKATLMFAPEVKCFTKIAGFTLKISKDALRCMMDLEHMVGNMTWLEDVEAAEPASVYTFALNENKLARQYYWTWGMVSRMNISLDDAADRMGELLDTTIKQHAQGNFRLGIGLSGGLDSRCLLAATHTMKPETYTFGIESSADVQIAKVVAKVAKVNHRYFDLETDHWLEKRFSGIWKTDGMMNMYHMHYSHLMYEISQFMDVNLSGFLGDVVMGGSYLRKKGKTFLNQRITPSIAQHFYGNYASFTDPGSSYFDIEKVDPYVMYNRGRRMIGMGAEEPNKTIPQRLPFMGNHLMEFCFSLPDEVRSGSGLYNKALLKRYPAFYHDIPNASTGLRIEATPTLWTKMMKMYNFAVYAVKYKFGIATSYTDAYNWLKEPESVALLNRFLDPKNAIYPTYTDENFLTKFIEPHVAGKGNYMKQAMGALTVEVWLQQLLNGKHRQRGKGNT